MTAATPTETSKAHAAKLAADAAAARAEQGQGKLCVVLAPYTGRFLGVAWLLAKKAEESGE